MNIKLPLLLALGSITLLSTSALRAADPPASWKKNCTICHGNDGKGKTKAGRKAKVKDLTDAKYQGSFSDEKAFKSIKEGIKEDGKTKMKAYGSKISDDEIQQLIKFIRSIKS